MRSVRAYALAARGAALALALCACPHSESISVTVSSVHRIVQANSRLQLRAEVSRSADQAVTWSVVDPPGLGSISDAGLYTAPARVDQTTDVTIAATAMADHTKVGTLRITVFAAPAMGVRQVDGRGEFYAILDGTRFVPRGFNYMRFSDGMIRLQDGVSGLSFSTFNSTRYDGLDAEQALARMEASGYNVVRTFINVGSVGDIGNESGSGLSPKYVDNLADFLTRARTRGLFVLPVFNELPVAGGYRDFIPGSIPWTDFGGTENQHKFTVGGIAATQRFWEDFLEALVLSRAPMDALWGYELMGEWYVSYDATPLNAPSGTLTTANGSTYDLGDPASRTALYDDNLLFYANTMRDAIHGLHPDALVVLGLPPNNGLNPPGFPTLAASALDFIDLHGAPDGYYTSVTQLLTRWQFNGDLRKPIVMGEFDAWKDVFPSTAEAAVGMQQWQAQACAEGFGGWLFWSWDTEYPEELWSALSGGGEINQALAPVNRPDPCAGQ